MAVVKKAVGKIAKKKGVARFKKEKRVKLELPTARQEPETDLGKYITLIYGREKWGKTTIFSTYPDTLFLLFEPGGKGLRIFTAGKNGYIETWEDARDIVDALEKTDRFKNVCFDTVDRAYAMCLRWVCDKRGIEYPGKDAHGKDDFGKSWNAVESEFTELIQRIVRTGRGVCFTSHAKEAEIETPDGKKAPRVFPSMSGQARRTVEALVDFFFYGDYVKAPDGSIMRVLITEGDETIWAGQRKVISEGFPRFLPILGPDEGYETIKAGFEGRHEGIDVAAIKAGGMSSKVFTNLITKMRTRSVMGKGKKGKKGGAKKIRKS